MNNIQQITSNTTPVELIKKLNELTDIINNARFVVESGFKNPSPGVYQWWRKYNDGWLEQGGIDGSNTDMTNNLAVPFKAASYFIVGNMAYSAVYSDRALIKLGVKSASQFYAQATDFTANGGFKQVGFYWYACGQGA